MSLWHRLRWTIVAALGAGLFGLIMQFILALSTAAGRELALVLAGATLAWMMAGFVSLPTLARSVIRFVIVVVAVWFAAAPLGMSTAVRIHPVAAVILVGVVSIGTELAGVSPRLRPNLVGATGLVAFAWVAGVLLGLPLGARGVLVGAFVVAAALWIASDATKLGPTLNKLVKTLIVAAAVWFASGAAGFPPVFQAYFAGFAALAFPFFVLLDARWSTEPPRHGSLAILVIFTVASVVLVAAGCLLPQYSTTAEQEKITRLQQSYIDRQADQRREEIRQQAEDLGLVVVEPTPEGGAQEGETVAEGAGPSQELIEAGKQAYDDYECYNCHKIGGKGGVKRRGPDLDSVGLLLSYDAVTAELLNPTASLAMGFEEEYDKVTMPDDFGERMSQSDIEAVAAYMVSLQSTEIESPRAVFPGPEKPDKGEGPFYEIPLEYQRMVPREWWADEAIVEEGKTIYEGQADSSVVCSACHGADGNPVMTGAANFTDLDLVESLSDAYWYWRIATGVPGTAMTPWESKLTPEQIMKVMVYQNTFAYDGEPTDHEEMFYPPKAQR